MVALALFQVPRPALAYCPTYTCEFDGRQVCQVDPVTGCSSGGQVAHWASDCLSYAVQAQGSLEQGISADGLRGILADGFDAWSDAACEGAGPGMLTPSFSANYRGLTACDEVEYNCRVEDNDNIVMFRDAASELSASTIALSTIVANLETGEILDVDIEINSRDFDFYVEPEGTDPTAHDLRLVLNHELGHMLGLSHSRDARALMRAEYDGESPLPTGDDVRGMCKAFPVSATDPVCSSASIAGAGECVGQDSGCPLTLSTRSGGCALGAAARSAPGWGWAFVFAVAGARRRYFSLTSSRVGLEPRAARRRSSHG